MLGLAGRVVPPLGKGQGVLLVEDSGTTRWSPWTKGGERFPALGDEQLMRRGLRPSFGPAHLGCAWTTILGAALAALLCRRARPFEHRLTGSAGSSVP